MTDRTLTRRALNRALLARQLLLERSPESIVAAVDQVGGLQTQYSPSGYVGLWTRLADFRRGALTTAIEDRSIIQATLMRVTIHMVSADEYWRYAMGVLPDPETPAPVRFLPHWDVSLLVHARRTGILPEAYRPRVFSSRNPFSVGTYLVDGAVAGAWSLRDGRVVLDAFENLKAADQRAVEREREALEAFHA